MSRINPFRHTDFILSQGAERNCGRLIHELGCKKVLLLCGRKSTPRSGVLERINRSLFNEGITCHTLDGVVSNPAVEEIHEGIRLVRVHQIDFVLAVGGGSVIDSAKAIASGAMIDGDVWDLFTGSRAIKGALPVGVVLTFLGSGSESSPVAVVNNINDPHKVRRVISSEHLIPKFCILNPEVTFTTSAKATAVGAITMLSCVLARYLAVPHGSAALPKVMEALMASIVNAIRRCRENPNDFEARSDLMWAEMMAYQGVISNVQYGDFNAHALEYALSDFCNKPYGNALSLIMPAYLCYILGDNLMRLAQFSHKVLGVPLYFDNLRRTAREGIISWYRLMREFELPTSLGSINLGPEHIPGIVKLLPFEDNLFPSSVPLDLAACEAVYTFAVTNPWQEDNKAALS